MTNKKVPERGTDEWKMYTKVINNRYKQRKKDKEDCKQLIINELHIEPIEDFDQLWDIIYKQVISEWEGIEEVRISDDYTNKPG